jgi:hypothetical protein
MNLIRELYGDIFSFDGSARGKIFKKLESSVNNLSTLRDVLRYNGFKLKNPNFKDDPSFSSPGSGISARFDLDEDVGGLSGGIDCKLTNNDLINKLSSVIISGPSNEKNPNLPIFSWDGHNSKGIKHDRMPEKFDFNWILASPKNIKNNSIDDTYNFPDPDKLLSK